MAKRNLNDPNIADIFRRLKRLETNTMLASASVGRGRLRFYDGSVLLIENGALNVTGTATISGVLDVSGRTNLKGQVSVTGPMEISGTTTITGSTNIMGELTVTGPTTLEGDTEVGGNFEIVGGGLFKSGSVEINPDGSAKFGQTTIDTDGVVKTGQMELRPDAGGQLAFNDGALTSSDMVGVELLAVNKPLRLIGGEIIMASLPLKPEAPNVYIDPNGKLWRATG
ncbi:MAG: hypothetical protein ACTICQ_13475 [Glutamicibacter arilaitensis]|uniref:hypothetical protein n=1 Tax=Glutamicibacter arilaitensis TaxID=256701 RepID=UPI003FB9613D